MATIYGTVSLTVRDHRGFLGRVSAICSGATAADVQTNADAFVGNVLGCTNATETNRTGVDATGTGPSTAYGGTGAYNDIGQQLRIICSDTQGKTRTLNIPAAKLNCFLTDGVTMDSATNTSLAALLAQINAGTVMFKGPLAATWVSGRFVDRRRVRRIGPLTRNPAGTGPA